MDARRIRFYYRGYYEDGTLFAEKSEGEPEEVVLGRRCVPERLEEALSAMAVGERKRVEVGLGYGERREEAIQRGVLRSSVPHGECLEEGMEIMWRSPSNPHAPVPARVAHADDYTFDLDLNHPLAGKNLVYEVLVIGSTG